MMRDDVLKRKMRAGRPEPTPEFSGSMRKALSTLQKKAARPTLPRLVPVSAVVFAAVAVLCVLALNNKTIMNFFAPGAPSASQQLAAGGETTDPGDDATARQTPCPTPSPNETSDKTADESGYYQKVGESKTDNGITETLVEVAADPFMLYAKFEFGPIPEGTEPNIDVVPAINGVSCHWQSFSDIKPVEGKQGYYEAIYRQPLLGSFSSEVRFGSKILDRYGHGLAGFSFDVSMELWKGDSASMGAVGEGKLLFGYQAYAISLFQSPQDVAIHLALEDNSAGDLAKYFNKNINKERGNGTNIVLFEPQAPQMLNMLIFKGLANENDLETLLSPAEGKEAKAAYDTAKGKLFLKYVFMLLERGADGKYYMDIVCMNPALRADTDLSLISNAYVQSDNGPTDVKNSILQIRLAPQNNQNTTPNPSPAVTDAPQDTPKPTPTPNTPDTTAMPKEEGQSQKVNAACTAGGITETVEEAWFDGYVYRMKMKFENLPDDVYPGEDGYTIKINGEHIGVGGRMQEFDRVGNSQELSFYYPAGITVQGDTVHVTVTNVLNKYKMRSGGGTPFADMKIEFDLAVTHPNEVTTSAQGFLGDKFAITGVKAYQSDCSTTLALTLKDDKAGDLASYLDKRGTASDQELATLVDPLEQFFYTVYAGNLSESDFNKDANALKGMSSQISSVTSGGWLTRQADGTIVLLLYLEPGTKMSGDYTIVVDQMSANKGEKTKWSMLHMRFN